MIEVIGLALVAAWYPPATIVVAHYLGGASGFSRAVSYWCGAAFTTAVVGVAVTAILRGTAVTTDLPPGVTKIVVGSVLIVTGVVIWVNARRRRGRVNLEVPQHTSRAGPFFLGVAMYSPSLAYLAALTRLTSLHINVVLLVATVVVLVLVVTSMAAIPIVLFVFAPEQIVPLVKRFNHLVHRYSGRALGVILIVAGAGALAYGLVQL
jgi:hypothetical protein